MSNIPSTSPIENDITLLDALSALQRVSAALNHVGAGDDAGLSATLRLIVAGAIQILPGASALVSLYDESSGGFHPASQASSGGPLTPLGGACPRESICFPLLAADQPVGALYLYLNDERPFSQSELLMLEILASHAATALYQTHLLSGVRRVRTHGATELCHPSAAGMLAASRRREPGCVTMPPGRGLKPRPRQCSRREARCLPATVPSVLPAGNGSFAAEQCHELCARGVRGAPVLSARTSELDVLTDREREVLALLAEGMTNKQIAAALVITPNTVKRHLKAIFEKLGIRTRSAAAAKAISARFPAF